MKNIDEQEVIELYRSGLSLEKVANGLGCSASPIKRILKKYNIALNYNVKKIDRQEAIELYQSGLTLKEVGERLGCVESTVYEILRKHNVSIRHNGRKYDRQLIKSLLNKGLTTEEITSKVGCSKFVVLVVAKESEVNRGIINIPAKISREMPACNNSSFTQEIPSKKEERPKENLSALGAIQQSYSDKLKAYREGLELKKQN